MFAITEKLTGEKITFEEFLMRSAQLFAVPTSTCDPSRHLQYIVQNIKNLNEELAEVKNWTPPQALKEANKYYKGELRFYRDSEKRRAASREAHLRMLRKATSWVPPTENYQEFKLFLIDQIEKSLNEMGSKESTDQPRRHMSGEKFKKWRVKGLNRRISDAKRQYDTAVQGVQTLKTWLEDLGKSLV